MANSLAMNTSNAVSGLGTFQYTFTSTDTAGSGRVSCSVQSTLPLVSGLQIVINHNGSPVVTVGGAAADPTPTQQSIGAGCKFLVAAADTVSVVFSSSNAIDAQPNSVKSVINLYSGE